MRPDMSAQAFATHVDAGLVCVSVAAVIIASYAALDLAQRCGDSQGLRRRLWIGGAGVTMGLGIWSMHFIGMLALRMAMPVSYNDLLVALSLLAAVVGASVSLAVVSRPHVSRRRILSASGFMGFAVAAMHYLGMASMQMAAVIDWNVALVVASLAIAFVASLFALWLVVRIRISSDGFGFKRRLLAAVLLGLGASGLHYTAMAASSFRAVAGGAVARHGLGTGSLVAMLTVGAGVMLAVLIGGAGVDQRRAALAKDFTLIAELARQLARSGDARGRICQAIQELAAADFVILIEPMNGAGHKVSAASGLATDSCYAELAEDPRVRASLSSNQQAFVASLEERKETPSPLSDLTGAASALYEPLSLDGQPVGVLVVAWRRRIRQLPDRTRTLLGMLAAEAAVAIDRETLLNRLEHLSRHDELTGLLNRRVLTDELDRQLAAAARHDRPLSLVMLDLDHFKDYNDTRGHQAGDLLLKSAAAAWTATLRQSDTMVRYGGEEFVAVMPDCTLEAAVIAAERLRAALPAGTTCSAGVASLGRGESWLQLIARADQALYEAKNAGRNRTRADDQYAHASLNGPTDIRHANERRLKSELATTVQADRSGSTPP
jgi:diguanylate cyclase (GGDEF)-like protein